VVLLGVLSAYTIKLLARSERQFVELHPDWPHNVTYVELGRETFGPVVGGIIWVGVVLTILGVCGVYLDFIGQSVKEVLDNGYDQRDIMLVTAVPLIFLSWLRSLDYLVKTSLIGDIAVTGGIIAVLIYGMVTQSDVESPFSMDFVHTSTFPQFFGQCVFLFAIHVVILPISQQMREPKKFSQVANYSFVFIVIVNAIFGFLGYVLYNAKTCSLVLGNVHGPLGKVVKVLLCLDLFFTIPIVLCAPRELIERLALSLMGEKHKYWKENLVRSLVVVTFTALAIAIKNINDLATLVGSLVSPTMGFIVPPLLHLHFNWRTVSMLNKVCHLAIVTFGAFACVYTTYVQIKHMIDNPPSGGC